MSGHAAVISVGSVPRPSIQASIRQRMRLRVLGGPGRTVTGRPGPPRTLRLLRWRIDAWMDGRGTEPTEMTAAWPDIVDHGATGRSPSKPRRVRPPVRRGPPH